jgi:hypothetical protein
MHVAKSVSVAISPRGFLSLVEIYLSMPAINLSIATTTGRILEYKNDRSLV